MKITIVGLGYVGLPLAHAFAQKNYQVYGYDVNENRVNELNSNIDRTLELSEKQLQDIQKNIKYTTILSDIKDANIYIVTVPTPIDKSNKPDLTPLIQSSQSIAKVLKKDDIVIYESTVYPGVTEEVCVPELEKHSGLKYNKDFFVGYSPERINPGDKKHTVTKILKVTSGSTPKTARKVDELYKSIIKAGTHLAPSIKVAEASKVIENTQRDVNIALINELSMIFNVMNIDTHAVLAAAGTKWNFLPFKPGLVGGHCIGVDPYYLTFKSEELGYKPNLILGARLINNGMGKFIAQNTIKQMIKNDIKIKYSNILILGATFKENCPDTRNTKVVDIIKELTEYEIKIDIYDPWIDTSKERKNFTYPILDSNPFTNSKKYDAIIVAVAHDKFKEFNQSDYESISKSNIIIDIKNMISNTTWSL